ncbi:uncharacterized protein A1O9_09659 [Exophiala aquamarina CBS 119918]|uniref:Zn(2)-C6 fungal-type domain-containing protein n=1 Tax=Exophiala aquamarina CBS 119918 TaxID=1182545 RepID=A0A072P456_9EURO|nr:uncharacterized protein A1O9_09659 [Exophiala aquamarina CBS 119918]KEF54492.1 hypothetical protein A1O9_09659 [Exophiala aquamarina CBS 119918]
MAGRTSSATLRTKTGCFTCRARRKKCTEEKPRCQKCTKSKRPCQWPNEADLIDRRNRRASSSPSSAAASPNVLSDEESTPSQGDDFLTLEKHPFFVCREISVWSDPISAQVFKSDLELACFQKFMKDMLPIVILSNSHAGFQAQHLPELVEMMVDFGGLKNIALACGATRIAALSEVPELSAAGLSFYAAAVTQVNHALVKVDWSNKESDDAILIAVIFLYIHGVFSVDTNKDIIKHLRGAIQLMKLRCAQSSRSPMRRPIHRIIWESILYQVFRQAVRHPFRRDFQPDLEFCDTAFQVLGSLTFPEASPRDNSPVIGIPIELFDFIMRVSQLSRIQGTPDPEELKRLGKEVKEWERMIIDETDCSNAESASHDVSTPTGRSEVFHGHSISLHVLATSLLLTWLKTSQETSARIDYMNLPPTNNTWQLRRALRILSCPQASKEWSKCYLGPWPALIFGYAVDNPDDVAVVRHDLQQRLVNLRCDDDLLLLYELEEVWRRRGIDGME